jgi:hypothetical protein
MAHDRDKVIRTRYDAAIEAGVAFTVAGANEIIRLTAERDAAVQEAERLREVLQDEFASLLGDIMMLTSGMPAEVAAKYRNCERLERIRTALGIETVAALAEQQPATGDDDGQ